MQTFKPMLHWTAIGAILGIALLWHNTASALACGDAVTTDVVLTADLHCTVGYTALEVAADNITIDLNGHVMSGTSALMGIFISNHHNVQVKNGEFWGFWAGVNAGHSDQVQVQNNHFHDLGAGVYISMGNDAYVGYNLFENIASQGIAVVNRVSGLSAHNARIEYNQLQKTRVGIEVCGAHADHALILSNGIDQSIDWGIHLVRVRHSVIQGNYIKTNGNTAVRMDDAKYTQMNGNSLYDGQQGINILAEAFTPCLNEDTAMSYKNAVVGNHVIDFTTGVLLGIGGASHARVYKNWVNGNKIYDDNLGIFLNTDAHINDASGNAYAGTVTPINDLGVGNIH